MISLYYLVEIFQEALNYRLLSCRCSQTSVQVCSLPNVVKDFMRNSIQSTASEVKETCHYLDNTIMNQRERRLQTWRENLQALTCFAPITVFPENTNPSLVHAFKRTQSSITFSDSISIQNRYWDLQRLSRVHGTIVEVKRLRMCKRCRVLVKCFQVIRAKMSYRSHKQLHKPVSRGDLKPYKCFDKVHYKYGKTTDYPVI